MADAEAPGLLPVAAERERDKDKDERRRWIARCGFAVFGIMSTLLVYGVLQEKIMRVPYGVEEFFRYSLFLVFCNRITTSMVSAMVLLASKKSLDPVAPLHKYGVVSISNILTTTCQYEALKYVSFPVQTLAKCAKMIPVMIWGTIIMRKKYVGKDYFFAVIMTMGCTLFILYPALMDVSPFNKGRESTIWGVSLMLGYLGKDYFFAVIVTMGCALFILYPASMDVSPFNIGREHYLGCFTHARLPWLTHARRRPLTESEVARQIRYVRGETDGSMNMGAWRTMQLNTHNLMQLWLTLACRLGASRDVTRTTLCVRAGRCAYLSLLLVDLPVGNDRIDIVIINHSTEDEAHLSSEF